MSGTQAQDVADKDEEEQRQKKWQESIRVGFAKYGVNRLLSHVQNDHLDHLAEATGGEIAFIATGLARADLGCDGHHHPNRQHRGDEHAHHVHGEQRKAGLGSRDDGVVTTDDLNIDDVAEWIVAEGEKVHCSRFSRIMVGLSDFISISHSLGPDSCRCEQRCHGTEEIREEKCRRRR